MGEVEVVRELREPIEPRAALLVVGRLRDEGIEVQLVGGRSGGEHHERAAYGRGVPRHQRRGAVAAQLGRAEPLEQREADGEQRQAGQRRQAGGAEADEDEQRRLVEHVIGVHVGRLVGEHGPPARVVEQVEELRVEQDDRRLGSDRVRVGEGELRHVEVGDLVVEVERVEDLAMQHPYAGQLLLAQAHRTAEGHRPQRTLVSECDEAAHDVVEIRDALQRRRGRAVGRVLVGPRGDALELERLDRKCHSSSVAATPPFRPFAIFS